MSDTKTRMVDLMTTMQNLTLRAVVSQTAAAQKQVASAHPAFIPANVPSTSKASPHTHTTYRKIAQPSVEHTRPPKLIPPATYSRDSRKSNNLTRVMHAESRDAGTDPMTDISSFDPFARGASTTKDYYSAASGMTTPESNYQTVPTSAVTKPHIQTFRNFVPRPVYTSTQRKITTKRNLD